MKVVLPEPDGPMMQTVSLLPDFERDALQHLEPAEALVDVGRPDDDVGWDSLSGHRAPHAPTEGFQAAASRSLKLSSSPRSETASFRSIVRLDDAPDRRQHQVPERDGDEVLGRAGTSVE